MIDRLEILAARTRRLISRTRWVGRLLGYPPPPEGEHAEAGLILIQIDGLGMDAFQRARAEGRMPFLAHLLDDEGYELHDLYTGMPSSTPAVQAELLYGQKTVVPAFGYRDAELDRMVSAIDPAVASVLESRMGSRSRGLVQGGSSWSNMFSGGAAEPHLCAATAGFDMLWKSLNVFRILGLVLWYSWSILRVLGHGFVETLAAVIDFLNPRTSRRELWAELKFVPTRVLITGVMREIVTAGAAIDAERGLPIIHLNFLGYDEHAHRRGPHSRFARWTLRGIDKAIRRVWLAAHRSTARDYQIWIYSDHGQETVIPYPQKYGRSVSEAVSEVVESQTDGETRKRPVSHSGGGTTRAVWLTRDLPGWVERRIHLEALAHGGGFLGDSATREAGPEVEESEPPEVEVVHQGPVGMVYLRRPLEDPEALALARRLAEEAHIPLVLRRDEGGTARAFTHHGKSFHLPEQGGDLFGNDHPFLRDVIEDTLRVVHHDESGDFVLMGFDRGPTYSLQLEHGSHGGPNVRETHALVLLPPEAVAGNPVTGTLRPGLLRERARRTLGGVMPRSRPRSRRPADPASPETRHRVRLLSYNVHGCRGMDGKYSPQRIARVIAREQPDIICLQEIDHGRSRSGGIQQIEEISRSLSTDYSFHSVFEIDDGEFGNAVLSHHRLLNLGTASLPALGRRVPNLEPRGVIRVQVCLENGCIEVVNTHLSILERERRIQVAELIEGSWLRPDGGNGAEGNNAQEPTRPLVFCGDFNASPRSYTCRQVEAHLDNVDGRWPQARKLKTWSSRIALRRIDQVFVNQAVEVVGVRVPRNRLTRVASDHLPLVVDLEIGI